MHAWQLGNLEIGIAQEFIQEDAAQTFVGAAVAREERTRHFLGQLQAKDVISEIGEEGRQAVLVARREGIAHHSSSINNSPDSTACPSAT